MYKTYITMGVLAATILTKTCFATSSVYCPQTIKAYCNPHGTTGPVTCALISQPSEHFDIIFDNTNNFTGFVTFNFHQAQALDGYALCLYNNSHQVAVNVTNKDTGLEMYDDTNVPHNDWMEGQPNSPAKCGSMLLSMSNQNCPFKLV